MTIKFKNKPRFSFYGVDFTVPMKDTLTVKNAIEYLVSLYIALLGLIYPYSWFDSILLQVIVLAFGMLFIYTGISLIEYFISESKDIILIEDYEGEHERIVDLHEDDLVEYIDFSTLINRFKK